MEHRIHPQLKCSWLAVIFPTVLPKMLAVFVWYISLLSNPFPELIRENHNGVISITISQVDLFASPGHGGGRHGGSIIKGLLFAASWLHK